MVTLEQVEKLREYANISYEEAKKVLEETKGDILEAIVKLEKENRISGPEGGYYNSREGNKEPHANENVRYNERKSHNDDGVTFGELLGRFFRWCGRLINRGNKNSFIVTRGGEKMMSIPVTILIILLLFTFWITVPLIIIGLFFGYKYKFVGPDLGKDNINRAMDSVAEAAENFAENIVKEVKGEKTDGEDSNN